jgi:hypothetical protein
VAGRPELTWSQDGGAPFGVAAVSAATVGAVVASRRPSHPVGWLLLSLGLPFPIQSVVQVYVAYGVVGRPGALPAARYLIGLSHIGLSHGTLILWLSCASFVLLLTPHRPAALAALALVGQTRRGRGAGVPAGLGGGCPTLVLPVPVDQEPADDSGVG